MKIILNPLRKSSRSNDPVFDVVVMVVVVVVVVEDVLIVLVVVGER